MKLSISSLNTERQWKANTGVSKEEFHFLLDCFKKAYLEKYYRPLAERLVENSIEYCIQNEEDLLLFTLFSLKSGLGYDALGFVCGMNGPNAKKQQVNGLEILEMALKECDAIPKRKFMDKKEFEDFFEGHDELLVDATEQRTQRPSDYEDQKELFSGKKSPYI